MDHTDGKGGMDSKTKGREGEHTGFDSLEKGGGRRVPSAGADDDELLKSGRSTDTELLLDEPELAILPPGRDDIPTTEDTVVLLLDV